MSLTLTLNNALSGLKVSQQSLAVLSQNISNANTPGYTRKVAGLSSRVVDGNGAGVSIEEVERKIDTYLAAATQRQTSIAGRVDTLSEFADRMQLLLGRPGDATSIDAGVTSFFSTLQTLADSPERSSLKLNAVNAGVTMANKISQLASDLADLRYQADTEISQNISRSNTLIVQLNEVNQAIALAFNTGKSTVDLLDKRDSMLNQLGGILDISYFIDSSGRANVTTNGGVPLLDSSAYKITYNSQSSADSFRAEAALAPIEVYRLDENGAVTGRSIVLATGGTSDTVATSMINGKLRGLMEMRDTKIPSIMDQLDNLASNLRDEVNAIHNSGIAYPGTSSYTGTRQLSSAENSQWEGKVRIALVDANGRPIDSAYESESSGMRSLTLDLSTLDTGQGAGKPSVQGIINEINTQFNQPQPKVSLGDINNIRMVSANTYMPGSGSLFNFDFDLENISADNADFYVTGIQVLDDTNTDITSTSSSIPSVDLASTGTYSTTNGSDVVTVTTATAHEFEEGQVIYLSPPTVDINGITKENLGGFFTVSNVTSTTFQITAVEAATSTGTANEASMTALPKYATSVAGDLTRTRPEGSITADLTANPASAYYVVRATVATRNADGTIDIGQIQYRINNFVSGTYNLRYSAESAVGAATVEDSKLNGPVLKAIMVDANGVELAKVNNAYVDTEFGYLKIVALNSNQFVAIDSMDSREVGFPNESPAVAGSNRGFSHYFELNNFFESNATTATGDTIAGSALNLAVVDRLKVNPNLISIGSLKQSAAPADPNADPLYTFERTTADNDIIQSLAGLITKRISFSAAGGLGESSMDFNAYAGDILGFMAADAETMKSESQSQKVILEGFAEKFSSVSGVNIDEELANTIIFQNSYTASARLITVTSQLFESLIGAFQG